MSHHHSGQSPSNNFLPSNWTASDPEYSHASPSDYPQYVSYPYSPAETSQHQLSLSPPTSHHQVSPPSYQVQTPLTPQHHTTIALEEEKPHVEFNSIKILPLQAYGSSGSASSIPGPKGRPRLSRYHPYGQFSSRSQSSAARSCSEDVVAPFRAEHISPVQPQPNDFVAAVAAPSPLALEGESPVANAPSPEHSMIPQPIGPASQEPHSIPMEMNYIPERRVLAAVLELPGFSKDDLIIGITTCPIRDIRILTVTGIQKPYFPSIRSLAQTASMAASLVTRYTCTNGVFTPYNELSRMSVRTRKYGQFHEEIAIPGKTKEKDVAIRLENGLLMLEIQCPEPAVSANFLRLSF